MQRRRRVVGSALAASLLLAILLCILVTRKYQAAGIIQLQKSGYDSLGLDSAIGGSSGGASDALSLNIDIQTQSSILQSETLALRVIEQLNLESDKDFRPRFYPISWALSLITPSGASDTPGASLEESPNRSQRLIAIFAKNLRVKSIAGTRLIEVDYSNSNPKVAASVVNALIEQLIEFTFQVRFKATNQASKWLEAQLGDLRDQSEQLQARLVSMQKNTGLYGAGGVDPQGKPVIYSPALDRLQQATASLSQAEGNRILKGAVNEMARTRDADLISQLSGPMGASSQGVASSLGLIQALRAQEAGALAQEKQDSLRYGPLFPKLIEERASLGRIQKSIEDETARVASRAENDYRISEQQEAGLRVIYQQDRAAAAKLNDTSIEYTILQREADQSQQLYQSLLSRLKEAGVLEGLHSSNLTVVTRARPPSKPNSPNVPLYLMAGLIFGLLGGLGAAFGYDSVDNRIHGADEIEAMELPLLGLLPRFDHGGLEEEMPMLAASHSPYAEAMRRLRSTLLLSRSGVPPKVFLVTSAGLGEGKSTVATNLAVAFAQTGQRVLLVETDMRRPVLRSRLTLPVDTGLSQLLSDSGAIDAPAALPGVSTLFVVAAGPVPPYPADLLGSARFGELVAAWREEYGILILDSPPLLPVADAQLAGKYADATLLVARSGVTTRTSLQRAYNILLPHLAAAKMGVVFNAVATQSPGYLDYYGYRQTSYFNKGDRL